jgi:hypothetical protein
LWHKWRYSKDQAKQSWIVLDLINPYWLRWIMPLITPWSLIAKIFVRSLMEQFIGEIGLKSDAVRGFFFLGTKVMQDPLILCKQIFPS